MNSQPLSSQIDRLDHLVQNVKEKAADEYELSSWGKYICVLASGVLENAVKNLYSEYASRQASKPIASFIETHLGKIRSPNTDVFLVVATAFSGRLSMEIKKELEDKGYDEAIDSIIRNRHLIVHGKEKDCAISFVQAVQYYENAKKGLAIIETKLRA